MNTRRVFAAIDLNAAVRSQVAKYCHELRREFADVRVRWERPEKLHMTLRFEAHADAATLAELESKLRITAAGHAPFELAITGTGGFANRRGPTVLWLGIDAAAAKTVSSIADQLGNTGRFHPHITIARIKYANSARELIERHRQNSFGPAAFILNELVLIESTLTPDGSVYNVLLREPLRL